MESELGEGFRVPLAGDVIAVKCPFCQGESKGVSTIAIKDMKVERLPGDAVLSEILLPEPYQIFDCCRCENEAELIMLHRPLDSSLESRPWIIEAGNPLSDKI